MVVLTMLWLVAVSSSPPNVMIGVRHAKYIKKNEARHCGCKASLKSLKYHGALRITSLRNPPNNLHNKTHPPQQQRRQHDETIHQINETLNCNPHPSLCCRVNNVECNWRQSPASACQCVLSVTEDNHLPVRASVTSPCCSSSVTAAPDPDSSMIGDIWPFGGFGGSGFLRFSCTSTTAFHPRWMLTSQI